MVQKQVTRQATVAENLASCNLIIDLLEQASDNLNTDSERAKCWD